MIAYEEAVKRWAAKKWGGTPDDIISVSMTIGVSDGCDTCGPEVDIDVSIRTASNWRTEYLPAHSLEEIIGEVLAAGQ